MAVGREDRAAKMLRHPVTKATRIHAINRTDRSVRRKGFADRQSLTAICRELQTCEMPAIACQSDIHNGVLRSNSQRRIG